MILGFYRSKSRSFQNPKKNGFLFSVTRNPGFKILPRFENTSVGRGMNKSSKNYVKISIRYLDNVCAQTGVVRIVTAITMVKIRLKWSNWHHHCILQKIGLSNV